MLRFNSFFIKKLKVLLFLFCFVPFGAIAQNSVKGTVSDGAGEPIIGASVRVVGTNTGVVTDVNGQFNVNAASNGRLTVSYVGFVTQEVSINGRQNIVVPLPLLTNGIATEVVAGW